MSPRLNRARRRRESRRLQGVHVIEGVIQLLADRLVPQFLSVQLVCRSKVRWRREEAECKEKPGGDGEKSDRRRNKGEERLRSPAMPFIPSKSSMVFSSFATVRSANSARVSAFKQKTPQQEGEGGRKDLDIQRAGAYLLQSVIQDFNLLLVFVLLLRVLQENKRKWIILTKTALESC